MQTPFFNVIFRACDAVAAVNNSPRPFGLDKKSLIKICFESLYTALQPVPHHVTVFGDKLSDEMMEFFSTYPGITLTNGNYGNDESIRQSVKKGTGMPPDHWVYFCEDDYLHRPETFLFISRLIEQKEAVIPIVKNSGFFKWPSKDISNTDLVIFPTDYRDRYLGRDIEPFYIFYSSDCHWRQVANITFTFAMQAKIVKKYQHIFLKASTGACDGYLSKALFRKKLFSQKKCICLSPMPGLTAHMHHDTLTPLINWEKIMETNRTKPALKQM